MATYRYKAKDEQGKTFSGSMNANTEQDLHERLKNDGKFLIDFKEEKGKVKSKRLKYDRLSDFSRNLSKLIKAGITLVKALRIISEDEAIKPQEREIYAEVLRVFPEYRKWQKWLRDNGSQILARLGP